MPRRTKSRADVLNALSADEGFAVLRALLAAHPELTEEARAMAMERLVLVERQDVAEAVVACVAALGLEQLSARAGRQLLGYVQPTEAAWAILDETIAPYTQEVERLLALGLEGAARAQCEGVLLGLHVIEVDHSSNELLQYAVDFPSEAAGSVLEVWSAALGGPRRLDKGFVHDNLFEWVEMVEHIQGRGGRTPS